MPPERRHILFNSIFVLTVVIIAIPFAIAEGAKITTRPIQERLIVEPRRKEDRRLAQQNAKIYHSLGSDGPEIRLIELLPAKHHSDGIECVSFHRVRSKTSYEALSYAWGDLRLQYSIKVDGLDFAVTKNLYVALKCLRLKGSRRTLWIDAICINQADNTERTEQVKQMQFIYESAINVVVWLEEPPENIEQISNLFDPLTELDKVRLKRNDDGARVFQKIFMREWWKRMWVIQEVLLARSVIVQTGEYTVSWERLCQLVEYYEGAPSTWHGNWEAPFASNLIRLRTLHKSQKDPQYGLLSLAWEFRERKASDDRDKLFALLGLLPQKDLLITPDYSQDTDYVYRHFTKAWINKYRSLLIINLTQYQSIDGRSWYLKWSREFGEDVPKTLLWDEGFSIVKKGGNGDKNLFERKFSAAGGHPAPDCTHTTSDVLRLHGFEYSMTTAVGEKCDEPVFKSTKYWQETMKEWMDLAITEIGPMEADIERSFHRTVTFGLYDALPKGGDHSHYRKVFYEACNNRRFFVTARGTFGLGPVDLRKGDAVCVFLGSAVPFILADNSTDRTFRLDWLGNRVKDSKSQKVASDRHAKIDCGTELSNKWKFIGDAYVDEIMTYKGDIDCDIASGKLVLRDFFLC